MERQQGHFNYFEVVKKDVFAQNVNEQVINRHVYHEQIWVKFSV